MKNTKNILKYVAIIIIIAIAAVSTLYYLRLNITQKEKETYASAIKEGDRLLERRDYGKALENYADAAETIPQKKEAYDKIVDLLVLKRRFDDAKDVVEKSTKVLNGSDRSGILRKLSLAYYNDNQYEKAEKYYLDADSSKSTEEGFLGLARTYLKLNNTEKANKFLGKIDSGTGNVALEKGLLSAYLLKTNTVDAKKIFDGWDLTLEEDKDLITKANDYIKLVNSLGKDDLYNKALLAREYINSGYPVIAIELLEPEGSKMKDYPDGLYFLARAYYDAGKYSSALDILNQALGFDTYADEMYLMIARINMINNDQNAAFDAYEKAVSFASDSKKVGIYEEYVSILLQAKSFSEAKNHLDAVDKITTDVWVQFKYIEMYYEQKDYPKILSALAVVSKISALTDEEKKEYMKWQIVYDIENDKLASAKELLGTLKSLDRFNPEYYLLSGRIDLIENSTEKAKENLNTAINYDLDGEVTESAKKLLGRIE